MKLSKPLAIAAALMGTLAVAPAEAAGLDDYGPLPFNWTGFYVGANVGGVWADVDHKLSTPGALERPFFFPDDAAAIARNGSGSFSSSDVTAGVQAGYNYQVNQILVGAEVDWGLFGLDESSGVTGPTPGAGTQITTTSIDADSLVTLRGRLGWVTGRTLFYATAGAAYSRIDVAQTTRFIDAVPTVDISSVSEDKWGWTVGGGVEWALQTHWTIKGEYLYVDLGSVDGVSRAISPYGIEDGTVPFRHSADVTAQLARIGLNYKF